MPEEPKLDLRAAVEYLELLRPLPPWVLTSIIPDGLTRTKTFMSLQACEQFIAEETEDRKNVYYSAAEPSRNLSKKATKADIKHTWFLHVDADPRDDETPEAFKARMLPLIQAHPKRAALVVDSGNGLQILWRLDAPCADQSEVEAANYALAVSLGADPSTRNVDRILRLPGTINFPGKTKIKRGRVKCATRLVSQSDARHSISDFEKAAAAEEVDEAEALTVNLSEALPAVDFEKLHPIVKSALEACKGLADTSVRLIMVARAMLEQGYGDDQVAAVLMTESHEVSEHVQKKKGVAMKRRAVVRAILEVRKNLRRISGSLTDLFMLKPEHRYIDSVTRDLWPAVTVDSIFPPVVVGTRAGKRVTLKPSRWVDQNQCVDQMCWLPGAPTVVEDCYVSEGGVVRHSGKRVFNTYHAPRPNTSGDAGKVGPWTAHVQKLFPHDWHHIIKWLAWRVRHPEVKINHALVLGSKDQGIGKDALLDPVRRAVGTWNCHDVTISQVMGRFNGFLKAIILRVSEARDLGGSEESRISRTGLYDHMKNMLATPPEVLRIDEKNRHEYYASNVVGVVITTNYKAGGIYLPAEDRRHFVAWSDCVLADFDLDYFNGLYRWYEAEGYGHVEAYLRQMDLRDFDPKAHPPKTQAFWEIATASASPEYMEIASALDEIVYTKAFRESHGAPATTDLQQYWPKALTIQQVMDLCAIDSAKHAAIFKWLEDRRNRRAIPNRLEQVGYVPVKNGEGTVWSVREKGRMVVYARVNLPVEERRRHVMDLASQGWHYERWIT